MNAVLDDPSVKLAAPHEQRLGRAEVLRFLPQQYVGQQRDGLDVAARPARVVAVAAAASPSDSVAGEGVG